MTGIPDLLLIADAYGSALQIPSKTVSKRALQDSSRLDELRSGACDIGVRRLERTVQWFSDNWPSAACWPSEVPRPLMTLAVGRAPDLSKAVSAHA